jgi:uncharacterized membrane protein
MVSDKYTINDKEGRSTVSEERTQNDKDTARSKQTQVSAPGRTASQAEGERDEKIKPSQHPQNRDPGMTPGQAEGERDDKADYEYQRRQVRQSQGNGKMDENGDTKQALLEQAEKVREQVETGLERFNETLNESEMASKIRHQFQSFAEEQGFNTHELKRWLAMIGGGYLAFQGLRRSLGSLSIASLGAAIFYWGYSGESILRRIQRRGKTTHWEAEDRIRSGESSMSYDFAATPKLVTKSIIVKAETADAFKIWANFENFPRFMQHIKSVNKAGEEMSHWIMEGPLGTRIEWDAKVTRYEENKRIGWSSIRGDIKTSGQVTFNSLPSNETEVTVTLQYVPPVGLAGEVIAELFDNPERKLEEDLRNFKRFMENREQKQNNK